jgi:hypothetical protein
MNLRKPEEVSKIARNLQEQLPVSEEEAHVLLELQEPYMFMSYEYRCLSCTNPYSGLVYTLTSLRRKGKFLSNGVLRGEQVLKTEDNITRYWFKLCLTP